MTKTIVQKLNLAKYHQRVFLNQPQDSAYFEELTPLKTDLTNLQEPLDLLFTFVESLPDLIAQITHLTKDVVFTPQGYLFVAYPKIGNQKYPTSVHRDAIFPALGIDPDGDGYLAETDFKFSRMVSLDDTFTIVGLKYLPKKKTVKSQPASQRVSDYEALIPKLKQALQTNSVALTFFESLTPGYQRSWARYVYSAKQDTTRQKRLNETVDLLLQGFKSKDLASKNS
ncbi:YdeI/OmpD-associated family protein [Vagococcus salmoninarum]|uniref:YdeI/OmpD-associated family protein n=1 Tax=Vagococcus salmoninarum TaxID=2739 RepID=UPI0028D8ED3E|nr:YdeI/OmpD-associated family protein [Vagococcus salmoninarum]